MISWIYNLAGKFLASKLNLQEGLPMDQKPWYKSKTIWSDIVTILLVAYNAAAIGLAKDVGHPLPAVPDWILGVLAGIGIYSRTTASTTIGS